MNFPEKIVNPTVQHVMELLDDKSVVKIVQIAPSIYSSWFDSLLDPSSDKISDGMLVSALRRIGFDYVFDVAFGADMTILEESAEFIKKNKEGKKPLFTSCCPAWVSFAKLKVKDILPYLSSAKSPHEMLGTALKVAFAKKMSISSKKIVVVSLMPCATKKDECNLSELLLPDGTVAVDFAFTVREFYEVLVRKSIDVKSLEDSKVDDIFQKSSGGGKLFGKTAGVAEATLRSVCYKLYGKDFDLKKVEIIKKETGLLEKKFTVDGKEYIVAAVSGLKNVMAVATDVLNGESQYDLVEVMSCPYGCVSGPFQPGIINEEIAQKRMKYLRGVDEVDKVRTADENPDVMAIYKEFFDYPGSEKAEKYLHRKFN